MSAHDELVTKAERDEPPAVVRELAEIQTRTDEKLGALAEAQTRPEWAARVLAKQVGGLSAALGGSLADFACDLAPELLDKHWAMVVDSAAPRT